MGRFASFRDDVRFAHTLRLVPPHPCHIIRIFLEGAHDGFVAGQAGFLGAGDAFEHALVILWQHFHELPDHVLPQIEDLLRTVAVCEAHVTIDHATHFRDLDRIGKLAQLDHLLVATRREIAGHVEHVGHAAAHPGGEVASGRTEHHHAAAGHVFATVIAHGLDDGAHARVAHREPFARHAADVNLAARRAIQTDVADDDIVQI